MPSVDPNTLENILILLAFYTFLSSMFQNLIDCLQGNDNTYVKYKVSSDLFSFGAAAPSGPGLPHSRGF